MKCNLSSQLAVFCISLLIIHGDVYGGSLPKTNTENCFQLLEETTLKGDHAPSGGHLQGLVTDKKHLYWSFTRKLVKTDLRGKVVAALDVAYHHGDLAYHDGRIYVSFFTLGDKAQNKVLVYDTKDLSLVEQHDVKGGKGYNGGLEHYDNHFYLGEDFQGASGRPLEIRQFDMDFKFIKAYTLVDKKRQAGSENIARFANSWWVSSYDPDIPMLRLDDNFRVVETFSSGFPFGFFHWNANTVLVGQPGKTKNKAQWLKYNPGGRSPQENDANTTSQAPGKNE